MATMGLEAYPKMYEQNETPIIRRIALLAVWFILILVVLWFLVWLIFFRHNNAKKTANKPATTQSQSHKTPQSSGASNSGGHISSDKTTQPSSTAPASSPAPTDQPGSPQLANTGAGNVAIPVALGTAAGTAFYYVRLRRKTAQQTEAE